MRVVVFRCLSVISVVVYLETSKHNGGGGSFVSAGIPGQKEEGGVTTYNISEIYGEDLIRELEPEGWQEYGAKKWAKGREKVGGFANTGLKWLRNNDKVNRVLNSNAVKTVTGYGQQAIEKTKEGLNRWRHSSDDESSGQEEERVSRHKRRHRDHGKHRHHHHHHHREGKMKPEDYQGACVKHCANIYGFLFESYSEDGVPRFSNGGIFPITRGKAELKEHIKENSRERRSTYVCDCKPTSDFEMMVKTAYPEVENLFENFMKQQLSDPAGAVHSASRIFEKLNWDWKELQKEEGIQKPFNRYFYTDHRHLLNLAFQEMVQFTEPAKAQKTEEAKQRERSARHRQGPRADRATTGGAA